MNRGGKIVTPIRDCMEDDSVDGVIFQCKDRKEAEKVRVMSIITKHRNAYDFRTHRDGNNLIVHKPEVDIYDDPIYIIANQEL